MVIAGHKVLGCICIRWGIGEHAPAKKRALVVALIHTARVRARTEITTMSCKRMASIHQRAREWREQLREANRAESGRLWEAFGEILTGVREALNVSPDEAAVGVAGYH